MLMTHPAKPAVSPNAFYRWETPELLREYARNRDIQIRNELILRHQRLVRFVATRFTPAASTTSEDLMQVSYLGLIAALDRFNPEMGQEFTTFAMPTIMGIIKHYLRDQTWFIKAPRRLRELSTQLRGIRNRLEQQHGRAPTVAEMAAAAEVTEERILQAMEVDTAYYPASLDATVVEHGDHSDEPLSYTLGAADPAFAEIDERDRINSALDALEERERLILRERFWDDATQQQVADRLGISQMHVSRLERRALERLREVLQPGSN